VSINFQSNSGFGCALLGTAVVILFFWSVPVAGQSSDENLAIEHTKVTASAVGAKRFEIVSPRQSGITFTNHLAGLEYYKNMVAHNGAGVAVGDVNGDGSITSLDALLCVNSMFELYTLQPIEFLAADIDGTGSINIYDVLFILDGAN